MIVSPSISLRVLEKCAKFAVRISGSRLYYKDYSIKDAVLLSSGHRMPTLGLGTKFMFFQETADESLSAAIDVGYRHIDTTFGIASEKVIGEALTKLYDSGKIKREELFLVNKVPYNKISPGGIEDNFKKSAEALNLDSLDLYLIEIPYVLKHKESDVDIPNVPLPEKADLMKNWRALESLVKKGCVKSIGLSNFDEEQIQLVFNEAEIKPAILQIECNAYKPEYKMQEFCKNLNIAVSAFRPIGCPDFEDGSKDILKLDYNIVTNLLEEEIVKYIAYAHDKTSAQIVLRYIIQRDLIAIPEAVNAQRIRESVKIFDQPLYDEEIAWMLDMVTDEWKQKNIKDEE